MARARLCALTVATFAALMSVSPARAATADDRYGPPGPGTINKSHPLSLLSWPGKPQAPTPPAPARPTESVVATSTPASAPAAALPTSLYAAPVQASAAGQQPHRYSVDREFGVQPDPIPAPEPFFANSPQADLAEPPPPPPAKTANGANSFQARNAAANANDGQGLSTLDSFGSN